MLERLYNVIPDIKRLYETYSDGNFISFTKKQDEPKKAQKIESIDIDDSIHGYTVVDDPIFSSRLLTDVNLDVKNYIDTYRLLAKTPDLSLALGEIENEVFIVNDPFNKSVDIVIDDSVNKKLREAIVEEYNIIYTKILDFNNKGVDYFMNWYIDGKIAFQIIVNKDKLSDGIIKLVKLDSRKIKKVTEYEKPTENGLYDLSKSKSYFIYSNDISKLYSDTYYTPPTSTKNVLVIDEKAIAYIDSGIYDELNNPISHLHKVIVPYNNMKMMEEALLIFRVVRCLEGNTLIFTKNGNSKKIKDVNVGDIVYSYNNETNLLEESKVLDVINNGIQQIWEIKSKHRQIECNFNHPFLVKNIITEKIEYIPADRLFPEQHQLILPKSQIDELNNTPLYDKILSVTKTDKYEDVWDIRVDNDLSNFVANGCVVHNSPERLAFYVNVGGMSKKQSEQYLNDLMRKFKNKLTYDKDTGTLNTKSNILSMVENYWLPRRGDGKGTEIETLSGSQNVGVIEDVQLFIKKFYEATNVPISRFSSDVISSLVYRSTEINRDEYRFKKFLDRRRNEFIKIFEILLKTQLLLKKIIKEQDWYTIKDKFIWSFSEDNNFVIYKEMEKINSQIETLKSADEIVDKYFTKEWLIDKILRLSEEEKAKLYGEKKPEDKQKEETSEEEIPEEETSEEEIPEEEIPEEETSEEEIPEKETSEEETPEEEIPKKKGKKPKNNKKNEFKEFNYDILENK